MTEENQIQVEMPLDDADELSKAKRIAFFVKVLAILLVLALATLVVYYFMSGSNGNLASYNSDLETLATGRKSTNQNICSLIGDNDLKNTCLLNVAENTGDQGVCSRIPEKNIRYICLYRIAKRTKDKTLCEGIENPSVKQECYNL